ncbi:PREDICTED: mucin-5AC-like isoform X5 [Branchiostoma belcheri]|uniref:Mucin-5AC-like isoform X5 n=1 Tax=Branchiostoma belcheri TaxID=7741 RepID=A0A6P4YM18_BRABE|nr:PREDICTED: mucin-5AC-like isoform X5 [Branchiostoma belcheri]
MGWITKLVVLTLFTAARIEGRLQNSRRAAIHDPMIIPVQPTAYPAQTSIVGAAEPTVEQQAQCVSWSQEHYLTFDGQMYNFKGQCTYKLVGDCADNTFNIHVRHQRGCNNTQPCHVEVILYIGNFVVTLRHTPDGPTAFDGDMQVSIPANLHGLLVERIASYVVVRSGLGFKIKWDGADAVYVEVTEDLFGKTCGLCGKYDRDVHNDFTDISGKVRDHVLPFAASWKMPESEGDICSDSRQNSHCNTQTMAGQIAHTQAAQICTGLKTLPEFQPCHEFVDQFAYYESCKEDVCLSGGLESAACNSFEAYFRECLRHGVHVNWRSDTFCPANCAEGMEYRTCGTSCPETCRTTLYDCEDNQCIDGCHCPEGTYLNGGECLPHASCPCLSHGVEHPPGSHINSDCNDCECVNGKWECTTEPCEATCIATGDPHYITFDGRSYDFMGDCSYTMVMNKMTDETDYSIEAENQECDSGSTRQLTCTRSVTVKTGSTVLKLKQGKSVLLNGEDIVRLPHRGPGVYIETATSIFQKVTLDNGLRVLWDGVSRLYITAPPKFVGRTMGLCGTFNYNQQDDFYTKVGDIETNPIAFANKWKTDDLCADRPLVPTGQETMHPCDIYQQLKTAAQQHCGQLMGSFFTACHQYVNPQESYDRCMFDYCGSGHAIQSMCDAMSDYSLACGAKGVELDWRQNTEGCEVSCSGELVYDQCHPGCQTTCASILEGVECEPFCVEGCACPEGTVLDYEGHCVPPEECGCMENGKHYLDGASINRGCNTCMCSKGQWACTEMACLPDSPALCPDNQIWSNCVVENQITCKNMHLGVTSQAPVTCHAGCQCRNDTVWDEEKGACVMPQNCPCYHGGQSYEQSHTIQLDCNTCFCNGQQWVCEVNECAGICTTFGDPHYKTFDGKMYEFQGDCDYVLAKSKDGASLPFSVTAENIPCGTSGVTCTKNIIVTLGSGASRQRLSLVRGQPITADGTDFTIRQAGMFVFVSTPIGLTLQWDKGTRVYIKLVPAWKGYVEGLCGNFNGNQMDDFTTPMGGPPVTMANTFGDSWKVHDYCMDAVVVEDTCALHPNRQAWALRKCAILKSDVFRPCHSEVPYQPYYDKCVYDACGCDSGGDCECLCTAIAAYAQECNLAGVPIKWREQEICPMQCEYGMQYVACSSSCPKTCDNMENYSEIAANCTDTCVEGCACPPGFVVGLNGVSCVLDTECFQEETTPLPPTTTASITTGTATVPTTTTMRPTTTTTPKPTTTTPAPVALDAECVQPYDYWTEWMNVGYPSPMTGGDYETIENLRYKYVFCQDDDIVSVECKVNGHSNLYAEHTGQVVTCDTTVGLVCNNMDQPDFPPACYDYAIRFFCSCGELPTTTQQVTTTVKPTTTAFTTTTATSEEPTTTTKATTTMLTTTATTTEKPPPPSTTTFTTSTASTTTKPFSLPMECPVAGADAWTPWMNVDTPANGGGGDYDTLEALHQKYVFCEDNMITQVECQLVGFGTPADQTGQKVTCDVTTGLICIDDLQLAQKCYDYEIRVFCACGEETTTGISTTTGVSKPTTTVAGTTTAEVTKPTSTVTTPKPTSTEHGTTTGETTTTGTATTTGTKTPPTTTAEVTKPTSTVTTPKPTSTEHGTTTGETTTTGTATTTGTKTPPTTTTETSETKPVQLEVSTKPQLCPVPNGNGWTSFMSSGTPTDTSDGGEFETIDNLREHFSFCPNDMITDVQCSLVFGSGMFTAPSIGQAVTCNTTHGLICLNEDNPILGCMDYQVQFYCECGPESTTLSGTATSTIEQTTTGISTTTGVSKPTTTATGTTTTEVTKPTSTVTTPKPTSTEHGTTTGETTTTGTATTTGTKTPPTTTAEGTTHKVCVDGWTTWVSSHKPNPNDIHGGDIEDLSLLAHDDNFNLCGGDMSMVADIQCQEINTQTPWGSTGQLGLICDTQTGFSCSNSMNYPGGCQDYEISVLCQCVPTTTHSTTSTVTSTTTTLKPTTQTTTTKPHQPPMTTAAHQTTSPGTTIPTTPQTLPPLCEYPDRDFWTQWMSVGHPGNGLGDIDTIEILRTKYSFCENNMITAIDCRVISLHDSPEDAGQKVVCDAQIGLICVNSDQQACYDYEVRFFCECGPETTSQQTTSTVSPTTTGSQTATTTGIATTTGRTTTTGETTTTTTGATTAAPQVCVEGWTTWISSHKPNPADSSDGDFEYLNALVHDDHFNLCGGDMSMVADIQCQEINTQTPWDSTGQDGLICDTQTGFSCSNSMNQPEGCLDYEISVFCHCGETTTQQTTSTVETTTTGVTTTSGVSPTTGTSTTTGSSPGNTKPPVTTGKPIGTTPIPENPPGLPTDQATTSGTASTTAATTSTAETTTTGKTTTTAPQVCVEGWTTWISSHKPNPADSSDGDFEYLNVLVHDDHFNLCGGDMSMVADIQCQEINTQTPWSSTGQDGLICNTQTGFFCSNSMNEPEGCLDYEISVFCHCGETTSQQTTSTISPTTTGSQTATTTGIATTTGRTTTTGETTTTTTGVTTTAPQVCVEGWTTWISSHKPNPADSSDGDFEYLNALVHDDHFNLCGGDMSMVADIQCQEINTQTPWSSTGQDGLTCDTQTGFSCSNSMNEPEGCLDYEISVFCHCGETTTQHTTSTVETTTTGVTTTSGVSPTTGTSTTTGSSPVTTKPHATTGKPIGTTPIPENPPGLPTEQATTSGTASTTAATTSTAETTTTGKQTPTATTSGETPTSTTGKTTTVETTTTGVQTTTAKQTPTSTATSTTTVAQTTECKNQWTSWMNSGKPASNGQNGDYETITNLQQMYDFCSPDMIVDVECRVAEFHTPLDEVNQIVTCDIKDGLVCVNDYQTGALGCSDYEIRFFCRCGGPTTTMLTTSQTSRPTPTTMVTTTTSVSTPTVTPTIHTQPPAHSTTPAQQILVGCEHQYPYWTQWMSVHTPSPNTEGDSETIQELRPYYRFCDEGMIVDVQCRVTGSGIPADLTGQTVTCDAAVGLTCLNADQTGPFHLCDDYEVRFFCACGETTMGPTTTTHVTTTSTVETTTTGVTTTTGISTTTGKTPITTTGSTTGTTVTPTTAAETATKPSDVGVSMGCLHDYDYWTEWMNTDSPDRHDGDDVEFINNLREEYTFCGPFRVEAVECRVYGTQLSVEQGGQQVTCDEHSGLICHAEDQHGGMGECYDYEIRFLCDCGVETTPPAIPSTTSTAKTTTTATTTSTGITTTTGETTTTGKETPTTTTEKPTTGTTSTVETTTTVATTSTGVTTSTGETTTTGKETPTTTTEKPTTGTTSTVETTTTIATTSTGVTTSTGETTTTGKETPTTTTEKPTTGTTSTVQTTSTVATTSTGVTTSTGETTTTGKETPTTTTEKPTTGTTSTVETTSTVSTTSTGVTTSTGETTTTGKTTTTSTAETFTTGKPISTTGTTTTTAETTTTGASSTTGSTTPGKPTTMTASTLSPNAPEGTSPPPTTYQAWVEGTPGGENVSFEPTQPGWGPIPETTEKPPILIPHLPTPVPTHVLMTTLKGCEADVDYWTLWMNVFYPTHSNGGDFETLDNLRDKYMFCDDGMIVSVECRTADVNHIPSDQSGQKVICDIDNGLICSNDMNAPEYCHDYEIRFFCDCGVEPTTLVSAETTTTTQAATTGVATTTGISKPTTTVSSTTTGKETTPGTYSTTSTLGSSTTGVVTTTATNPVSTSTLLTSTAVQTSTVSTTGKPTPPTTTGVSPTTTSTISPTTGHETTTGKTTPTPASSTTTGTETSTISTTPKPTPGTTTGITTSTVSEGSTSTALHTTTGKTSPGPVPTTTTGTQTSTVSTTPKPTPGTTTGVSTSTATEGSTSTALHTTTGKTTPAPVPTTTTGTLTSTVSTTPKPVPSTTSGVLPTTTSSITTSSGAIITTTTFATKPTSIFTTNVATKPVPQENPPMCLTNTNYWTEWMNTGSPSTGEGGDFESIDSLREQYVFCDQGMMAAVQCRVVGTNNLMHDQSDQNVTCSIHQGLECHNMDQVADNYMCHDYEIRFFCECGPATTMTMVTTTKPTTALLTTTTPKPVTETTGTPAIHGETVSTTMPLFPVTTGGKPIPSTTGQISTEKPPQPTTTAAKPTTTPPLTSFKPTTVPVTTSTMSTMRPFIVMDTCIMFDDTIQTFDGTVYDYPICNNVLAKDCVHNRFEVHAFLDCTGADNRDDCNRGIYVRIGEDVIILDRPNTQLTLNGQAFNLTQLPTLNANLANRGIRITSVGNEIIIQTNFGINIYWSKTYEARIVVHESLQNMLCGMCGTYNHQSQDDFTLQDASLTDDAIAFGDSWMVGECPFTSTVEHFCPPEIEAQAEAKCDVLRTSVFSACHPHVPVDLYYHLCVNRVCECHTNGTDLADCECDPLSAYATTCERLDEDIVLDWRNPLRCPAECPPGMVYHECGPGCPTSCDNMHDSNVDCNVDCVSGCFCPDNMVQQGDQCIRPALCTDCYCYGYGDPHYITFDGTYYPFQGQCSYVLARETTTHEFEVIGDNELCEGGPNPTCTKSVTVRYGGHEVTLNRNRIVSPHSSGSEVTVDGVDQSAPVSIGGINVFVNGLKLVLEIPAINLRVRYDEVNHGFDILVPSSIYYDRTEGLCGPCNYDGSDDLTTSQGTIETNSDVFALSWMTLESMQQTELQCGLIESTSPPQTECVADFSQCEVILSDVFEECHQLVNPQVFLDTCKYDVCNVGLELSCDSLAAYARECDRHGVCLEWREGLCEFHCPAPMEFHSCGAPCPMTCDMVTGLTPVTPCQTTETEGCFCPPHMVLDHEGNCVPPESCPMCVDETGRPFALGDTWHPNNDPCETCTCKGLNSTSCVQKVCPQFDQTQMVCRSGHNVPVVWDEDHCCAMPQFDECTLTVDCSDMAACQLGEIMEVSQNGTCYCRCVPEECPSPVMPTLSEGQMAVPVDANLCCAEYTAVCNSSMCSDKIPGQYEVLVEVEGQCCPQLTCDSSLCPIAPTCSPHHTLQVTEGHCCEEYQCVCDDTLCPVPPSCQDDEVLLSTVGECCTTYECSCDKTQCDETIPSCPVSGMTAVVSNAGGCCSQYECTCQEPMGAHCSDLTCPHGFMADMVNVNECGCPTACVSVCGSESCYVNGSCHSSGDMWTPDDVCTVCSCKPNNGAYEAMCETQVCTACPAGYTMVDMPGQCCGECTKTDCVIMDAQSDQGFILYQPGDEWVQNGEDQCNKEECKCVEQNGMVSEVCYTQSCPAVTNCPEEFIMWDEQGCCQICQEPPSGSCSAELVEGGAQVLAVGTCTTMVPVNVTQCAGHCPSFTTVSFPNDLSFESAYNHECQCCQPSKSERRTVDMMCEDGTLQQHSYDYILECTCDVSKCLQWGTEPETP